MRKVNEQQTTFEQGGFDGSGLVVDGDANNPNAGSTVKSWALNDIIGAFAAILKAAGIASFNGQPETEDSSQVLAAIQHLINSKINILNQNVSSLIDNAAKINAENAFAEKNIFKDQLVAENDAFFNKEIFKYIDNQYKKVIDESSILAYNYMNTTDVTNLINSKIEGLKQEIGAKYAALAGNNIFTGANAFNGVMATNSAVNHQSLPNYRGSSLVDRSYLSGKNYATRSYVSSSVSEKISVDTTSSSSETYYNVGSIFWGRYNPSYDHPDLNQRVYVRRLNNYLIEVTSSYTSNAFSGTWRAKGAIDEVDLEGSSSKDSATLVLVQRVS